MWRESAIAVRVSSTVVKTSWISPPFSMSTMCGRPSLTLLTARTGMPASAIAAAVPRVATSEKPSACRSRATTTARALSVLRTVMQTVPFVGRREPAPSWLFSIASPKVRPTPITSPVERISGPRIGSTPGNLLNGKTASLTEKYGGTTSPCTSFCSASFWPTMQRAAILASGSPVAFETKGTVRDARGFTSST